MNLAPYRKALLAAVPFVVTALKAFGVPVADDLSTQVVAAITAVFAVLVYLIPNSTD